MNSQAKRCKLLLIGWDAADWKFITPLPDAGLMPNLSRIIDDGVMGNLASLKPCLSPILWTSIATGKTADKHGIAGFVEPAPGGGGVRLSSSTSRKTKAVWNILSQNGIRSTAINWYASHPAEPIFGTCVSNRFFEGLPPNPAEEWQVVLGSVHPADLGQILSGFRMHPAEFAIDDLVPFIPMIRDIDLSVDPRPRLLAEVLARSVSIHSVATGAIEAEPWDFLAVYYDGLDVAGHEFMPFHPPQLPSTSDRDFQLYQHVMREMYHFHDSMLGTLLDLAGDDTTVLLLSDHGFHCDHLRPQTHASTSHEEMAASWHRHYGIVAMKGPGILRDERIYGANLLDIAPTILGHFGLPIGKDMDGKQLRQAYAEPGSEAERIPSWDLVAGEDGMHPARTQQAMMSSPAVVAQLVALGYLPAETIESAKAEAIAVAESQFNLAVVHSSHGRPYEAQILLEQLCKNDPAKFRYAIALAKVYANQGMHDKCLAILRQSEAIDANNIESQLLFAAELVNTGQIEQANTRLQQIKETFPASPSLYRILGEIHLLQCDWESALGAFRISLELDEDDPHCHNGLARAAIKLNQFEMAGEHALRAIGLLYFFPQAHFHMGQALKGLKEKDRAIRSFQLAVSQAPGFLEAHSELANLYDQSAQWQLWSKHHRLANRLPAGD